MGLLWASAGCALILAVVVSAVPPPARASELAAAKAERSVCQRLLLELVINGNPADRIGEFSRCGEALFARSEELQSLGFKIPKSIPLTADGLVALESLRGFSTNIDESTQTLYVRTSNEWLTPTLLGTVRERLPTGPAAPYRFDSGTGATLNYDFIASSVDGSASASGLFDARIFSPLGVLSSGLLVYAHPRTGDPTQDFIRLDTTYVYSDTRSMRRFRLGDFISSALPWTRAVRMAGAQIDSDFSLRPDLITFPVPSISGSAAIPSTVDVLVNGTQVVSGSVPPGPFEFPQVPVVTGAGTVQTTVTDALGRQIVTELPFYASPSLLAPSLQTYSGEIGFVRRNWGLISNDYGDLAAALTYRRGISPNLTVEAHAERTNGLTMGGVGGVLNLSNIAIANFAIAGSDREGRSGAQIAAGLQRLTSSYNLGGSLILATRRFGDIAAVNGDPIATLQINAEAGVSIRSVGSLGIVYSEIDRLGSNTPAVSQHSSTPALNTISVQAPQHLSLLSGSYSRQFGRVAVYATAFRDFADRKTKGFTFGLTVPLGARTSVSAGIQSGSGRRSAEIDVSRNANEPGEWGFRAYASGEGELSADAPFAQSVTDHEFGQLTYKSEWGEVTGGIDRFGDQTTVQGELRGAVSILDGAVFASNWIDDSFAVVDTTGAGGIRVRQENRDVGRTGSQGRLLVADLRSFEPNDLSIEPVDAPIDATIVETDQKVRPQDQSGVVVKFPIRITYGALLRLVDRFGKPVPMGSTATLRSTGVAAPVGYDGVTYLTDLQAHNEVVVGRPDGARCIVTFEFKRVAGQIPTIGPLTCREPIP